MTPAELFPEGGSPVALLEGDCLERVAELPEVSVDAIVTDPPYHLSSIVKRFGPGGKEAQHGTDGLFRRASKGFMGKEWDGGDIAFRPETWAALLRVAKPGAHLVAFNHSRTWHHMALAIEAAGWEIRDSLMWLYGSGFPKSHDVSKGIDRMRDDREAVVRVTSWLADHAERAGVSRADVDAALGTSDMGGWWLSRIPHRCALPTPEQWDSLRALIGFGPDMDPEVARLNARKGTLGEAWAGRDFLAAPTGGLHQGTGNTVGRFKAGTQAARGGVRPEAREWEGWGTALKPAFEPIVLARKPLAEGSVARQCLATGTGALNVDAGRIGAEGAAGLGRWPANVAHDGSPEVVSRFPADGSGSAARFFYCGKADASDRAGSDHPTVKPQALMRWLVRLTARRGGVVLDPFGGSGATGWAAAAEGCRAILCEREAEYLAHLRRRVAELDPEAQAAGAAPADALPGQLGLFGGAGE